MKLSLRTVLGLSVAANLSLGNFAFASGYDHVMVANRASGTLSVIGLRDSRADLTQLTPDYEYNSMTLGFDFEPMYLAKLQLRDVRGDGFDTVSVADRKNNQILVFQRMGGPLADRVLIGKGAFHLSTRTNEVYVATDGEKGFNFIEAVFPTATRGSFYEFVNHRFDLPAQYLSGSPHDIIGSEKFIYLTVHGVDNGSGKADVILQVDKKTLKIVKTRKFNAEVHLFDLDGRFVILEQQTGKIRVVDSESFKDLGSFNGPVGVHGINAFEDGNETLLFVTDIDQADGKDAVLIYSLSTSNGIKLVSKASTSVGSAHNIGFSNGGVFITHSGAQSSAVSVLKYETATRALKNVKVIHTGLNPFGIAGLQF